MLQRLTIVIDEHLTVVGSDLDAIDCAPAFTLVFVAFPRMGDKNLSHWGISPRVNIQSGDTDEAGTIYLAQSN